MDHNASADARSWPPVPRTVLTLAVTVVVVVGASPLIGGLVKERVPALVAYLPAMVLIVALNVCIARSKVSPR